MSTQATNVIEQIIAEFNRRGIPCDEKGNQKPLEQWTYSEILVRLMATDVSTPESIALHDRAKLVQAHELQKAADEVSIEVIENMQGVDFDSLFAPGGKLTTVTVKAPVGNIEHGTLAGKKVYCTFTAR